MTPSGYMSNGHAKLGYTSQDSVPEQPLRLTQARNQWGRDSHRVVDKDGAWMADFRNPTDAKRFVEGYGKGLAPPVREDRELQSHMMVVASRVAREDHGSTKEMLRAVCRAIAGDANLRRKLAEGFKADGSQRRAPEVNAGQAAIRTLKDRGYTYHGAEYWKPPIGKRPAWLDQRDADPARSILLNLARRLRWARQHLSRARSEGWPEVMRNEAAGAALEAHNTFQAAKQIVAGEAPPAPAAADATKPSKGGLSL